MMRWDTLIRRMRKTVDVCSKLPIKNRDRNVRILTWISGRHERRGRLMSVEHHGHRLPEGKPGGAVGHDVSDVLVHVIDGVRFDSRREHVRWRRARGRRRRRQIVVFVVVLVFFHVLYSLHHLHLDLLFLALLRDLQLLVALLFGEFRRIGWRRRQLLPSRGGGALARSHPVRELHRLSLPTTPIKLSR
jgi:hypothetical protein